jgi:hypothetical protein
MTNFNKELTQKLAQVYCLPQHSHKVLDAGLITDMVTAITILVR